MGPPPYRGGTPLRPAARLLGPVACSYLRTDRPFRSHAGLMRPERREREANVA